MKMEEIEKLEEAGIKYSGVDKIRLAFWEGAKWMRSQSEEQWVDVNERLPEINQSVLFFGNDLGVLAGKYKTYQEGSPGYIDGLRDCWFEVIKLNTCLRKRSISHWQPLPQPPRKETNK